MTKIKKHKVKPFKDNQIEVQFTNKVLPVNMITRIITIRSKDYDKNFKDRREKLRKNLNSRSKNVMSRPENTTD